MLVQQVVAEMAQTMSVGDLSAAAHQSAGVITETTNPFSGLKPDFGKLGTAFDAWWKKAFGAAWAVGLLFCGAMFIPAIGTVAAAKGGSNPHAVSEATSRAKYAGGALAFMLGLPIVLGAFFLVLG